jgi:hypothetical protein
MDSHAASLAFRKMLRTQIEFHPMTAGEESRGEKRENGPFPCTHGLVTPVAAQNDCLAFS